MHFFTADQVLEKRLDQLTVATAILGANGNVLGTFTPNVSPEEQALYEKAKSLFDPDETERIFREERGKGIPFAEVWKQVESKLQP